MCSHWGLILPENDLSLFHLLYLSFLPLSLCFSGAVTCFWCERWWTEESWVKPRSRLIGGNWRSWLCPRWAPRYLTFLWSRLLHSWSDLFWLFGSFCLRSLCSLVFVSFQELIEKFQLQSQSIKAQMPLAELQLLQVSQQTVEGATWQQEQFPLSPTQCFSLLKFWVNSFHLFSKMCYRKCWTEILKTFILMNSGESECLNFSEALWLCLSTANTSDCMNSFIHKHFAAFVNFFSSCWTTAVFSAAAFKWNYFYVAVK